MMKLLVLRKKNLSCLLLTASLALLAHSQERIYEHVEVINQEVLVRVFLGGKPVPGLKLEDFVLFENGQKIKINYCRERRRSMAGDEAPATSGPAAARRERLFLFMLWFNEESREWSKAWDYFLKNIYRPGDHIILSDGEQVLEVTAPEKEGEKLVEFFKKTTAGWKRKKMEKTRLVRELENNVAAFRDDLVISAGKDSTFEFQLLADFKRRYRGAMDEYLLPLRRGYPRWLQRLAESLKVVDAEKWVLVFLQNERIPLISRDGRLFRETPMPQEIHVALRQLMEETERQLQLSTDVIGYFSELQPLFTSSDATFHLFLCDAADETLATEHMQWKPVFSSWDETFRQISASTGGHVNDTTRLADAIQEVAAAEDVYYVLTYLPAEGKEAQRSLKIEVNRPGARIVHSRKLTKGELFPLRIKGLEWQDGKLKIALTDFQRQYGESGLAGHLRLGVQAQTKGKKTLSGEIEIMPKEAEVTVELALRFSASGRWKLKIEAKDLLSGNRTSAMNAVEIPERDVRPMGRRTSPLSGAEARPD
jgi:hypothetical protein